MSTDSYLKGDRDRARHHAKKTDRLIPAAEEELQLQVNAAQHELRELQKLVPPAGAQSALTPRLAF